MDTRLLRTFLAVNRHRSYTRAARELNLSQSAVWRQMRQLEVELGAALFEQLGKALHVTDAGRALAAEAEKLIGQIARIEESVREPDSALHGRLRIGASTTPGYYLLPRLLGEFVRRNPNVELRYEVGNSATIQRMLAQNDLDLAFVGGRNDRADLVAEVLVADEIVCFAAPSHPLAKRARISPRELAAELCVIREPGSATRELFESWLGTSRSTLSRTVIIRCPEALKLLVASGIGFSFLSRFGIAAEVRRGELRELRVAAPRLSRPILLLRHVDKSFLGPVDGFAELCRAFFRRGPKASDSRATRVASSSGRKPSKLARGERR